jgi:hypothetical protein
MAKQNKPKVQSEAVERPAADCRILGSAKFSRPTVGEVRHADYARGSERARLARGTEPLAGAGICRGAAHESPTRSKRHNHNKEWGASINGENMAAP